MGDSFENGALHKELLDKYLTIKRSRRRRKKRVPANTWVTAQKLPSGYVHKRRKPPKIEDDDELDNALSSIEMNHCPSTNYDSVVESNQLKVNSTSTPTSTTQVTNGPLILEDFDIGDIANIDDNVLIERLFTNLSDMNLIMEQVDMETIKIDSTQQQQSMTDSQQFEFLNEIFKEFDATYTQTDQEFVELQLKDNFTIEPPQESVLSSTSPFPSSMSSPSIPSTSPNQQNLSCSPSPPQPPQPPLSTTTFPSPPTPACPSTLQCPLSSHSSLQKSPPTPLPRPSYGKDIYLLLNEKTNQSDSSDDESDY